LILVLVIVALLTITVTEFTYSVQLDQHRTRNAIHALQAQLLARSGINLAEGFLMLDEDPTFDAYTEEWWLQLLEFCREMPLDGSMRIRCTVRDESGKINLNNTREPRRVNQTQAVTQSAVLRDALRCLFERHGVDVEVVDRLADYWQQDPPANADGTQGVIPDFTSLEDFGATFGIPSEALREVRHLVTAQPRQLFPRINVNTAPAEVLAAVINAEQQGCPPNEQVEQIVERQRDPEQPFRTSGEVTAMLQGLDNANVKGGLFDVRSRLYRLEASALANVDPEHPDSGGIGQTLSALVVRQQGPARPGAAGGPVRSGGLLPGSGDRPLPSWTLRPLDWQKEGGARLFHHPVDEEGESELLDEDVKGEGG
jgi:type II secretory pathway component PulK